MACSSNSRGVAHVLWRSLVGLTFIFCSLLVYHFVIHYVGAPCSTTAGCSKISKHKSEKLQSEECSSVCTTKECIDISSYILSNIDQTADPCTDFYDFACGKFKDRYEARGNYSSFDGVALDLYAILRDVIETSKVPLGTAMHKLKVVYNSCMDTGSSELRGTQTLLSFLGHLGLRNWPHLSLNFSFVSSQLPEMLGKLNSYKQDVFLFFYASYFDEVSSENSQALRNLMVDAPDLTYHAEWEAKELEKAAVKILHYLGLDFKAINQTWKDFRVVENQIRQLMMNASEAADLCEEENSFQSINCLEEKGEKWSMLCRVLESVVRNGRITSRFNKHQLHVACRVKYYMERIQGIVGNYSDRVIANYIAIRVFIHNMKYMNFFIRKRLKVFFTIPEEQDGIFYAQLDKGKYCVAWIADNMQYPLGAMYVEKMWPKEAADEVNDMVQELLDTTVDFLLRQQWIGETTKEKAVKEVKEEENCIHFVIQAMRNKTKINTIYKRFNPTRSSFMRNVLLHNKYLFYLSMFHEEDMRYFYEFNPFVVNAYGGDNIYLTFGILLPPVFQHGYPNLFNIAKIGQIVGHEIGHKLFSFLEYSTDVDNVTRENFKDKLDCLTDQYFDFEQKRIEKYVRGNQTVSENFPDNMSIKVIEKASEKYLRNMTKNDFILPGINYSPEELLYISYAQTWCAVRSIEKERYYHDRDSHSPPEFRIKGAFQNSRRFSEVFNCSKTSFMNLKKKCLVFD